jgi:hypothetical protein
LHPFSFIPCRCKIAAQTNREAYFVPEKYLDGRDAERAVVMRHQINSDSAGARGEDDNLPDHIVMTTLTDYHTCNPSIITK